MSTVLFVEHGEGFAPPTSFRKRICNPLRSTTSLPMLSGASSWDRTMDPRRVKTTLYL
jgi:hypothetical protein